MSPDDDLEIEDVPAWTPEDDEDADPLDLVNADVLDEIAADAYFAALEPDDHS